MASLKLIYTLSYPENNIRYVGATMRPLQRYTSHFYQNKDSPKYIWINGLRQQGKKPYLNIIDSQMVPHSYDEGYNSFFSLEKFYISLFITWGFTLFNLAGTDQFRIIRRQRIIDMWKKKKEWLNN